MTLLIPGQSSRIVNEPARPADLTDTGSLAVTALAAAGPLNAPVTVRDMIQLERDLGPNVPWSGLHEYARAFFDRGGRNLIVQRYDGPAAAAATAELTTNGKFVARSPGTEGNRLSVDIDEALTGTARIIKVLRDTVEVERSPAVTTLAQLAAWASSSKYVIWDPEALAGLPAATVSAVVLVGGVDDHVNAGDARRKLGLDILAALPGTGQLAAVDGGTDQARADLVAATLTTNRHALLDLAPGATKASALAAESAISATEGRRYSQLWPQHALVEQLGVLQQVPWSAIQASLIATVDRAAGQGPHVAPAGAQGQVDIDGLATVFTEADRAELNASSINVARDFGSGVYRSYAWWSLADPLTDPGWVQSTAHREAMRIRALADPIIESFVAVGINPDTTLALQGEIEGLMAGEQERGAFNLVTDPAYEVTVIPDTETPAQARWDVYASFVPVRGAVRVEFNLTNRLEA